MPLDLDEAGFNAAIALVTAELKDLSAQEATPEAKLRSDKLKAQLRELKAGLAALSAETVDIKVNEDGITVVQARLFDLRSTMAALSATPINIKFDIEEADLNRKIAETEAILAKLDGKKITPELVLEVSRASADLLRFRAQAEALAKKRLEAVLDLDVNTAGASAEIAAFVARQRLRHSIKLDLEVDRDTLGRLAGSIGQTVTDLFESSTQGFGSALKGMFGELASGGKQFFSGFESGLGGLKGGLSSAAQMGGQLALVLLQVSALGSALALAGAAITAAYGAAATAIGALPGVISLAGAAAATVMLGLDGIKKAAQSIKPEFDKLKASVSATFEKGLTPAFQQLAGIFPQLQSNINGVAQALSITATNMVVLLTSAKGVELLQGIFDKTKGAILGMQPGLRDIVETFLTLSNQKSVFDALTGTINEFGRAFKAAVTDSLASGAFDAAMRGLQGTLEALARGFADLVHNGIELFARAAPGLNSALDAITGFFNRFDWGRLGTAVSDVFKGLATAINNIPQAEIEGITRGFEDFGRAINGPEFQAGFQSLVDIIRQFVQALPAMISGLSRAAVAVSGFIDIIRGVVALGPGILDLFTGNFGKGIMEITHAFGDAGPLIGQGMAKIAQAIEGGGPAITAGMTSAMSGVGPAVTTAFAPVTASIEAEFAKAGVTANTSMHNIDEAINRGSANWAASAKTGAGAVPPAVGTELGKAAPVAGAAMGDVPPAVNTALAPLQQLEALKGMRDQFTLAAADSMHAMSVGVQSGMAEVQQQFTAGMDTVSTNSNSAFQRIGQGFTIGMQGLAQTVTAGMPGIQAAFNFENIGTQVGLAFLGMVGSFQLGMQSLAATVTAGMPAIQAAFNFESIGLQVGQAFLGLVGTVTLGMQSIAATVTANMAMVNAAFNFTSIGLTVGQAFLGLVGSVTLGMQSIVVAVQTGMVNVLAAFNFANIGLGVGLAFQGLVGTFTLGMASLAATVSAGMPAIGAAFNMSALSATVGIAFQGLVGTFTLGMASIAVAVQTGMSQASTSMSAGMSGMAAAAAAGMSGVTSAIQAGMAIAVAAVVAAGAQIGAAAQSSMAGFGNSIRAGMAAATAAVAAGTAAMIAQFTQLGQQIVTTATQSMASFGNAVRAGMAASVAAVQSGVAAMIGALRAGSSQFFSVGVQMMQGLRAGILSQAGSIAAAAAAVVAGAIAAARAAANTHSPSRVFMGIGAFMGEGLAIGIEKSAPRVEQAADKLANVAVDTADRITAAFSDTAWADQFNAQIEHSFNDAASTTSTKDVVGQLRALNGNVDQSSYLSAIISLLQIIAAQGQGGNAAMGAQTSRQRAELGAF